MNEDKIKLADCHKSKYEPINCHSLYKNAKKIALFEEIASSNIRALLIGQQYRKVRPTVVSCSSTLTSNCRARAVLKSGWVCTQVSGAVTSGGTVGGATTVSPATQMQLHAMLQKSQQQQQQGGTVATVTLAPSGSTGGVTTALVPTRIMTLQQQPGAPTQTVALKQGLQVSGTPAVNGCNGEEGLFVQLPSNLSRNSPYCVRTIIPRFRYIPVNPEKSVTPMGKAEKKKKIFCCL